MEKVKQNRLYFVPNLKNHFQYLVKWNGLIIDVLLERGPQRFGELKEKFQW